jgi:predicted nucleotidyltransferase
MSLFEELIEDKKEDEKIIKSFKTKDSLCQNIFDGSKMKKEIRKKLLEISNNFIESLGVEFFIHDIVLTGSLANYGWSEYSDVDLHIIIDYSDIKGNNESKSILSIIKEFFDAKKNVWNEKHNVKIKNFDVELYVQDISEPHISSGVYSVLNDEWLIEPKKENPSIDDRKILEKGEEFAKKIDNIINLSDNENVIPKIEELRKKIKKFRQSGLEMGGEYSYENLTFKLLRRNGYIKKLLDLKTLADVFQSLDQAEVTLAEIEAGYPIVDAFVKSGFLSSGNETRRALKENAVSVNKVKVTEEYIISTNDLIANTFVLLQKGKKNYYILKVV